MYSDPSVEDFKQYFYRDFPYSDGEDLSMVIDQDISRARQDTQAMINPALFSTQATYSRGFLLLTAHNLVTNLRASSQGLSGSYSWLTSSKGVGSVSEANAIPQRILDNPEFAMLSKTNYGAQYLFIVLPLLTGQMFAVQGRTNA